MKFLLDEQMPHRLRHYLGKHDVFTRDSMGWAALKNGELLRVADNEGFEVFVTGDKKLVVSAEPCRAAYSNQHVIRNPFLKF